MVLSQQLYYETQLALNDLSTDLHLNQANFVLLYNKQAEKWLKNKIELSKNNKLINDAQHWLVSDSQLTQSRKTTDTVEYKLPEDYFDFVDSVSSVFRTIEGKKCEKKINNYPVKPLNKNLLFDSMFEKPSFEWEEGLCYLTGDKLAIYYTDFEIIKSYASYYKRMEPIDLGGYSKFDNTPSRVVNPTYSKHIADEICDMVVREVHGMYQNQAGFQISDLKVKENQLT